MHKVIARDHKKYAGHFADRPRHTQQLDYFIYEREMRAKEIPAGQQRVERLGPVPLAGRAPREATTGT
jgi:hypothetical protein